MPSRTIQRETSSELNAKIDEVLLAMMYHFNIGEGQPILKWYIIAKSTTILILARDSQQMTVSGWTTIKDYHQRLSPVGLKM